MPGFVDVSKMSDLEIKRLGQADEADDPRDNPYSYRNLARRNPYAYRKPMNKTPKATISHNADDVWAAAVQAQSINGRYIKNITDVAEGQTVKTNRQIVDSLLADITQITQESRDQAVKVRNYYKAFTFKILQGKQLNDFNKTAMQIAERDTITSNYDLAVIISLPASYEKSAKRDDVDRRINFARGGYIGVVGDKVSTEIEVVKQIWSQNWNNYYITGINDNDQVLFFAYKTNIEIGDRVKIQGTIKAHCGNSTQLNRVKVIK